MEDSAVSVHAIDKFTLKQFSEIASYRGALNVAFNWGVILTTIALCVSYFHPIFYVFAVILIGARQHALLILAHEAVHCRLMKSRKINDFVATIFCAAPLLLDFRGYRSTHLQHHRHLLSEKDPDWIAQSREHEYCLPKSRFQFIGLFLRDVTGLGTYRLFQALFHYSKDAGDKGNEKSFDLKDYLTPVIFFVMVMVIFTLGWLQEFFMYWLVPAFTWLKWVSYLRAIGEHHGLSNDLHEHDDQTKSRTTLTGWFGRTFITPHNANYHTEHHLYPGVPCYKLPQFHSILLQRDGYRANANITHGYLNVIRECISLKSCS